MFQLVMYISKSMLTVDMIKTKFMVLISFMYTVCLVFQQKQITFDFRKFLYFPLKNKWDKT